MYASKLSLHVQSCGTPPLHWGLLSQTKFFHGIHAQCIATCWTRRSRKCGVARHVMRRKLLRTASRQRCDPTELGSSKRLTLHEPREDADHQLAARLPTPWSVESSIHETACMRSVIFLMFLCGGTFDSWPLANRPTVRPKVAVPREHVSKCIHNLLNN
jgi:hypothetical protein